MLIYLSMIESEADKSLFEQLYIRYKGLMYHIAYRILQNREGAKMIAEQYPQLRDRFYIQIYNTQDYEAVSALGFQNIILTVYQMTWAEKADTNALVAFANSHTLAGITFPIDLVDLIPGYLETLVASGTPVFVHTVNDAETQRMLFDAGVAGVYTDGTVQ